MASKKDKQRVIKKIIKENESEMLPRGVYYDERGDMIIFNQYRAYHLNYKMDDIPMDEEYQKKDLEKTIFEKNLPKTNYVRDHVDIPDINGLKKYEKENNGMYFDFTKDSKFGVNYIIPRYLIEAKILLGEDICYHFGQISVAVWNENGIGIIMLNRIKGNNIV